MNTFRFLGACSILVVAALHSAAAERLELKNGNFEQWENGIPTGWTINVGARSGNSTSSTLTPLDKGGMQFSGDASTGQWKAFDMSFAFPASG